MQRRRLPVAGRGGCAAMHEHAERTQTHRWGGSGCWRGPGRNGRGVWACPAGAPMRDGVRRRKPRYRRGTCGAGRPHMQR